MRCAPRGFAVTNRCRAIGLQGGYRASRTRMHLNGRWSPFCSTGRIGIRERPSPTVMGCQSMCLKNLMHWPAVERIWLPGWLRDRSPSSPGCEKTVDEAKQRVLRNEVEPNPARRAPERRKPAEAESAPEPFTFSKIAAAPSSPPQPRRHPMIQTYRPWVPRTLGDISASGPDIGLRFAVGVSPCQSCNRHGGGS